MLSFVVVCCLLPRIAFCVADIPFNEFQYRQTFTILNPGGNNTLSDVQILVEFDSQQLIDEGKLRTFCIDLGFFDATNFTLLDFWLESGCGTAKTQVWIRISEIPRDADVEIVMSYGHSTAPSRSIPWGGRFVTFTTTPLSTDLGPNGWFLASESQFSSFYYESSNLARTTGRFVRLGESFGLLGGSESDWVHRHAQIGVFGTGSAGGYAEVEDFGSSPLDWVTYPHHRHGQGSHASYSNAFPLFSGFALVHTLGAFGSLPEGLICLFLDSDSAQSAIDDDPSDWTEVTQTNLDRRMLKVEVFDVVAYDATPAGSGSFEGGESSHTHSYALSTRNDHICKLDASPAGEEVLAGGYHHPASDAIQSIFSDNLLPYVNVFVASVKQTSRTSPVAGMHLLMMDEDPPLGWIDVSSAYSDRLLRATPLILPSEIGQIGGSFSHTHASHTIDLLPASNATARNCEYHFESGWSNDATVVGHEHSNDLSLSATSTDVPFATVRLAERIATEAEVVLSEGEMENFVRCYGVPSSSPDVCTFGNGICEQEDTCVCIAPFSYGSECSEIIGGTGALYFKKTDSIEVPFEVSFSTVLSLIPVLDGFEFDCSYAVHSVGSGGEDHQVGACRYELSEGMQTTKSLILELEAGEMPSTVTVLPVTDSESPVQVQVRLFEFDGGAAGNGVALAVGIGVPLSLVILLICGVLLVALVVFLIWSRRYRGKRDRIRQIEAIPDLDILLEETDAIHKGERAHLSINESLFQLEYSDIELVKELGRGGSLAIIFEAKWNEISVAFKLMRVPAWRSEFQQVDVDEFEREVAILASVSHPRILHFFGAVCKPPRYGILMELCELGDLEVYLTRQSENHDTVPFEDKIRMLGEVVSALEHLHSLGLAHRDVKPKNVLVKSDRSSRLTDFGLTKMTESVSGRTRGMLTNRVGTTFYIPPEVFLGSVYDSKCDVFSFGIMMYTVLTEKWCPYSENEYVDSKVASDPSFRPNVDDVEGQFGLPSWIVLLMSQCWLANPTLRPTFVQISRALKAETSDVLGEKGTRWKPSTQSGEKSPPTDRQPSGELPVKEGEVVSGRLLKEVLRESEGFAGLLANSGE